MNGSLFLLPLVHGLSIDERDNKIILKQKGRLAAILAVFFIISMIYDLSSFSQLNPVIILKWVVRMIVLIVCPLILLLFKVTIDKHYKTLSIRWVFITTKYPLNGPFFVRIRDHTTKRPYVELCYEHKTVIRLDQKTVACQRVLDYMKEIGVKIEYGLH